MKLKIILLSLCGALSVGSCSDYFDPNLKGNVPEDLFYENLNNLRYALNTAYSLMETEKYQRSELLFGEAISDNCWNVQDVTSGEIYDILNFQFNTENSYILERYQVNYEGINKVNQIIRSIPHVKYRTDGTSPKEIREVYGQAKVLRALFYFNLVKTFGGVSIQPEIPELSGLVVPRSTLEETYAYIEKDLRESILLLRKQRYQLSEAGQISAGGALGLLMKVLLYEASPGVDLPNVDKTAKWNEVVEIGKYFIEGQNISVNDLLKFDSRYTESWDDASERLFLEEGTTLETMMNAQDVVSSHSLSKFDEIFRISGEFSPESLIEINQYDYSGVGINEEHGWLLNGYITYDPESSILNVSPTSELQSQFENDPRELFTISDRSINDYYKQDTSNPEIGWFNSGNSLKFCKFYVFPSEGSAKMRNYVVMRYAEVLLIYAEALNEIGLSREAVDMANRVRNRAAELLDDDNPNKQYQTISAANFKPLSYAPYNITRDAILKEKRIEMAGEGDRWFEICRLGIVSERMKYLADNPAVEPTGQTRVRGLHFKKGVNEIFPIPQEEVFISNGVIEQNFGY